MGHEADAKCDPRDPREVQHQDCDRPPFRIASCDIVGNARASHMENPVLFRRSNSEERVMMKARGLFLGIVVVGIAVFVAPLRAGAGAPQLTGEAVRIDSDDIGGVVTSAKGPEAGVWVIAETTDLPTKFVKIVVTDDRGRYVVPDLPKANYKVWVRGYGLVDSQPVQSAPGKNLNLTAVIAPDARAAAQYYPGNYWYSLMKIPDKNEFPGKGGANGLAAARHGPQRRHHAVGLGRSEVLSP